MSDALSVGTDADVFVMSRKFTTLLLASIVICKLLRLKILHISFLLLLLAWAFLCRLYISH